MSQKRLRTGLACPRCGATFPAVEAGLTYRVRGTGSVMETVTCSGCGARLRARPAHARVLLIGLLWLISAAFIQRLSGAWSLLALAPAMFATVVFTRRWAMIVEVAE